MAMSDSLIVICPACAAANRVPRARLGAHGTCGRCGAALFAGQPVVLNSTNFDKHCGRSDLPLLVDFWAAWCGPCRALAPIVDEVAKQYQGKIVVGKMDVDKNTATPQRYGVRGIPTLLVFNGGQVREQIVGYVPKETIEKAIDKNLA
jgi:thioredoxin